MIATHMSGAIFFLKSKFFRLSMSTVASMLESTSAEEANSLKENYVKWLHEQWATSFNNEDKKQPSVLHVWSDDKNMHS